MVLVAFLSFCMCCVNLDSFAAHFGFSYKGGWADPRCFGIREDSDELNLWSDFSFIFKNIRSVENEQLDALCQPPCIEDREVKLHRLCLVHVWHLGSNVWPQQDTQACQDIQNSYFSDSGIVG